MDKGDYVIFKLENKNTLGKIEKVNDKKIYVVLEKNRHIPGLLETTRISVKEVVLNLGKKPPLGKAYDVDTTNLYMGKKTHDFFGDINFFYKPDKSVVKNIFRALNIAEKKLKDFDIDDNLVIEITPNYKSKYSGRYIHSNKESMPNRMQISPETMDASDYPYCVYHEFGHHLHYRHLMGHPLDVDWISLYNTSIKVKSVKKDTCKRLFSTLMESDDSISSMIRELEDEDKLACNWILREIGKIHSLSIRELNKLYKASRLEELEAIWPKHTLHQKDMDPIISLYATKNYKETVAESLAFYWSKKKLPKNVNRLIEKTIPIFRG